MPCKWFTFSRLPFDLRLEYQIPEGTDLRTPEEIRRRYETGTFLLWASEDASLLGFKDGIDDITLKTDEFKEIVLIRWLPAKGSGMVGLETRSPDLLLIGSKAYSKEADAWITEVFLALKAILGERVSEAPVLYDA